MDNLVFAVFGLCFCIATLLAYSILLSRRISVMRRHVFHLRHNAVNPRATLRCSPKEDV